MHKHAKYIVLFLVSSLYFLLAESFVYADWESMPIPGPQLMFDPGLTVENVNIKASSKKVSIEYIIINTTHNIIQCNLSLYMQRFAWPGCAYEDIRGNFKIIDVYVNNKKKCVPIKYRAFLDGRDITNMLKEKGISIDDSIMHEFNEKFNKIITTDSDIGQENSNKFFEKCEFSGKIGILYSPKWIVQPYAIFLQNFPPISVVSIKYEYSPFWGKGNSKYEYIPFIKNFNSKNFLSSISSGKKSSMFLYEYGKIKYNSLSDGLPPKHVNFYIDWSDSDENYSYVGAYLKKSMYLHVDEIFFDKNKLQIKIDNPEDYVDEVCIFAIE